MTGFDLLDYLWRQPADVLRSDIFAGLEDEDRIVNAFVTSDGFVSLLTEAARQAEEEELDRQLEEHERLTRDYWKMKSEEWTYDDYVQESIRRMNNDL